MQLAVLLCFVVAAFAADDCSTNEVYDSCGTACPLTCDNYKNPPQVCTLNCVPACHCKPGFVRNSNGQCVDPTECPKKQGNKCLLPPETGMCRGYFPSFYYDAKNGECREFIYGGCQGNDNRFSSAEECLATCSDVRVWASDASVCDQPIETGSCMALMHRYGYDKETGKCKKFLYGGCGGNKNNFVTLDQCRKTCLSETVLRRPDCDMDADTGLCQAYLERYYYADGECKKFIYGGCGGNRNNFKTEEECYNQCGALAAPSACIEDKEVGPCRGAFSRYFYNTKTGECEHFIYGGCQGNSNNFQDQEDCEAVCKSNQ